MVRGKRCFGQGSGKGHRASTPLQAHRAPSNSTGSPTQKLSKAHTFISHRGFPGDTSRKEPACPVQEMHFGSGRSPGGGHGNSLQYFCLENPMDRAATVHRVAKSQMRLK